MSVVNHFGLPLQKLLQPTLVLSCTVNSQNIPHVQVVFGLALLAEDSGIAFLPRIAPPTAATAVAMAAFLMNPRLLADSIVDSGQMKF